MKLRVCLLLSLAALLAACDSSNSPVPSSGVPPGASSAPGERNWEANTEPLFATAFPVAQPPAPRGAKSASEFIDELEFELAGHLSRAERFGGWLDLSHAAEVHLKLARFTGRFEHYTHAEDVLAQSFERAPQGSGPHLIAARLAHALHRFDDAERSLQAIERGVVLSGTRTDINALRIDIAFARGNLAVTEPAFEAAAETGSPGALMNLAVLREEQGRLVEADGLFISAADAALRDRGYWRALSELRRGLLDLGMDRIEAAQAHYLAADAAMPGYYLVEEHIAETELLLGDVESALKRYRDVVARTDSAELTAALADALDAAGLEEQAGTQRAMAGRLFDALIESHPDAVGGHAIEYFIETDLARAEQLAVRNFELRPSGEAHTLLADIALRNAEAQKARSWVELSLSQGHGNSGLHAIAKEVYAALGDGRAAHHEQVLEAMDTGLSELD